MENLTIVVPYRNGEATIGQLLDSLPKDLPVIVVDDVSAVPYQSERVKVHRLPQRGYFAGACNAAIAQCTTDILILNQDVVLRGFDWETLNHQRETFAIIGDGVFSHPAWGNGYVQGTFLFIRRDCLEKVGLFNEVDYPLWGCTAEFQLRACRMGFEVLPTAVPGLIHQRTGMYGTAIKQALQDEPERQAQFIRTPPAISVIITCHNYGRFLTDAVNSLIGGPTALGVFAPQTFQSFEIIIVDDASTDETQTIGRGLANPWKGIHYIRNEVLAGSAAAMNVGIKASFGKVIAPLDADDMMESNRLEVMYRAIEKNPHSVVYDDPTWVIKNKRHSVYRLPEYNFDLVLNKNPMHKGIVYPRQAWIDAGGYPEIMRQGREDWAFNVALGVKGWCGIRIPQSLYLYRRHEKNRTIFQEEEVRMGRTNWIAIFKEQLNKLYPNLYAGERPMGCCGGERKMATPQTTGRTRGAFASQVGAGGMTLINYVSGKTGTRQFFGAVTRTRYLFGGQRTSGWVDSRDVPGLLELFEGKKPVFEQAPVKEELAKAIEPVEKEIEIPKPDPLEEKAIEKPLEEMPNLPQEEALSFAEPAPKKKGRPKKNVV